MDDLLVAINEKALQSVFNRVISRLPSIPLNGTKTIYTHSTFFGMDLPVNVRWDILFHLENGTLNLNSDGSVGISELDVVWERLSFEFGIDLPEFCIGGGCIEIWGRRLCLPRYCIFSEDIDIGIPLHLTSAFLRTRTEISFSAEFGLRRTGPSYPDSGEWQLILNLGGTVDVDPIDLSDMAGDLFRDTIGTALSFLPGWFTRFIGDPVEWLIRNVLDIGDDLTEWLQNIIGVELMIHNLVGRLIVELLSEFKVHQINDPYELLHATDTEDALMMYIDNMDMAINKDELILKIIFRDPS